MAAGELVIVNTSPLIAFQRAGLLPLLTKLPFDLRTTADVIAELAAGQEHDLPLIEIDLPLIELKSIVHPSLAAELHPGEASVIQAAMENEGAMVWIDERRGRFKADALGLPVVGTLGVLARAKSRGLIGALRPIVETMISNGIWMRPVLVETFLEAHGEQP